MDFVKSRILIFQELVMFLTFNVLMLPATFYISVYATSSSTFWLSIQMIIIRVVTWPLYVHFYSTYL